MGPRQLDRQTVEKALFDIGFSVFQETDDGLTIYARNLFPAADIALDWSRGLIPESDVIEALREEGIDWPT